jgi:type 1 glutamine amidotransferase
MENRGRLAPLWLLGLALLTPNARAFQELPSVLVVSGANNHHWEYTSRELVEMLTASGRFQVHKTEEPAVTFADAEALAAHAAIVLDYNGPPWGEPAQTNFVEAVRGGTGVVVVHAANNAFPGWEEYETIVGHLWREGTGHGRFHVFDVEIIDRDHPVTRGLADLVQHSDELYHDLVNVRGTSHRVLATALSSEESGGTGKAEPMITVGGYGEGRVFHTPLGHVWRGSKPTRDSFKDNRFRDLIVRGTQWAATGDVTTQLAAPNTLTPEEAAAGWRLLFDGKTTDGWRGFRKEAFPEQGWAVEDGALVCSSGGGDLATEEMFGDFELDLEFKVSEKANSGIIYRVTEEFGPSWQSGPEFQVLDDALLGAMADDKHAVGALYDLMPPKNKVVRLPGEWNRARISVNGWRIRHDLNGFNVLELNLNSPDGARRLFGSKFKGMEGFAQYDRGHIVFQDHGDRVAYRSIKIRDLSPSKWVRLFNGTDLTGWTHHLKGSATAADVWSVEDGILICKGTPAGYLRTVDDYKNFVLRLSWRFSPVTKQAGNSGVLFRMVGEDKIWPRSIEAQLQSGRAGDFWIIDKFPMTVEPSRTEGRNTRATHYNEKPIGEWNEYVITADGGTITVEVNGEVLNQGIAALEVPGKICLQSEGAEIHFRDIELTRLD